jgi:hypothetical protein
MATLTAGTSASTSLTALQFKPGYGSGMAAADIAAIAAGIKDDQNVAHPIVPASFSANGVLYIPNRGLLKMLPGDYVAWDSQSGWPILISSLAMTVGSHVWNHS